VDAAVAFCRGSEHYNTVSLYLIVDGAAATID
jgi:hypothetical protein